MHFGLKPGKIDPQLSKLLIQACLRPLLQLLNLGELDPWPPEVTESFGDGPVIGSGWAGIRSRPTRLPVGQLAQP